MVTMVNVIHLHVIDTVLVCRRWPGGGPEGERKGGMGWGVGRRDGVGRGMGWGGGLGWRGGMGWGGVGRRSGEEEGGGFIASAEGGEVFETLLHKLLCVMGV